MDSSSSPYTVADESRWWDRFNPKGDTPHGTVNVPNYSREPALNRHERRARAARARRAK